MHNRSRTTASLNAIFGKGSGLLVILVTLVASCALAAFISSSASVQAASAQTLEELEYQYQAAVAAYEDAVQAQQDNEEKIESLQEDIQDMEEEIAEEQDDLDTSTVQLYKSYPGRGKIIDMLLNCETLDEAISCYEYCKRIERYYANSVKSLTQKREDLSTKQGELEEKRWALSDSIEEARQNVEAADAAYRDANHSDGAHFHQKQGVSNNCGATAFIVGVNILLHENRYTDNVTVWKGPGFNSDSTTDLANKGALWLAVNQLSDQIGIEDIAGDIHTASELKKELEQGHVVVISSGSGSTWCYANGEAETGSFPYGHWIVFYYYEDGIYYANDSSAKASKGAGCPYTEEELQEWLNGRGNHFALRMFKKQDALGQSNLEQSDSPETQSDPEQSDWSQL